MGFKVSENKDLSIFGLWERQRGRGGLDGLTDVDKFLEFFVAL